ncbi:3-hydroxymyristoyl/3-hydroxydecanoyl-(acyl carrier protein) dehydratase [Dysgonomonas sp. PH5-45]|uniref:hypothetical protein n=1 Tax=unclassified Dysgonomonas TaxID=2630389 RepID=UPI002473D9AB|nr:MULTISPECIES: hypothetical protein [unclassified Dysgonomonas]MDH6353979.1 3-hydroxymyristoyl/3-hydroxydecanoyl-(acyl carrier protein) dehydratase [Dysgonomonas sp. PH5-45]MDH6386881.1 3-hydroxymyristoyl/3-hydroxydecanoyl-(acyl carrier protein) dehydratase [Dysgonomonas sp. PH5-37]
MLKCTTGKDNPQVQVFALHSRIEKEKETYATGAEILKKENLYLPSLSINIEDTILRKELKVKKYPMVLIFDKESRLIFRGGIEMASKYLEKLVD